MTDLSQYRVGPTKTRDGLDAMIHAIYPGCDWPIHGSTFIGNVWVATSWRASGQATTYSGAKTGGDILPNNLPTTVARWLPPDGSLTVSDTEREGWTRVEVPVQPVRGMVTLTGYSVDGEGWTFGPYSRHDPYRLTLPTEGDDLVCGDYRDAAGNVIKVERIK